MDNVNADFTINNNNPLEAEYSLNNEHFDCSFELFAAGTVWGSIAGDLSNQTDLQNALNLKANQTDLNALSLIVSNNYTELNNKIADNHGEITAHILDKQNPHDVTKSQVGLGNVDNTSDLDKPISTATQNALNSKQDTISDISTIRENAQNGNSAYETIQTYGDIVTYNASDFATSAQGTLADSALQPGDNISELTNDVGYITSSAIPTNYVTTNTVQTITANKTIHNAELITDNMITLNGSTSLIRAMSGINYRSLLRLNASGVLVGSVNENLTLQGDATRPKYNANDLALYSDLPTLADLTTQAQLDAINSGATTTNIGQIATNTSAISDINDLIPTQATSSNQLADKDFVNSSIATNTANFIGTFNSVAELEAYSGPLTNNDYAFVATTDTAGNTLYDRYKYNADTQAWLFEYELNNSSFTAAQWAAINSGITSGDVTLIGTALQPNDNISELVNDSGYITGVDWGDIGGTLSDQTDLQNALNAKYDASNPNGYISSASLANLTDVDLTNLSDGQTIVYDSLNTKWVNTTINSATWGNITGTLSNQTDLQNALNAKQDVIDANNKLDYAYLSNTPTIPTVNDATLTIQQNGTPVNTFTANASSNVTANIIVPTDTSDLTNGAGYITGITSSDVTTALGFTPYNSTNPNGYITASALNGYATENWVGNQGYITGITSSDVTTALGYTPLSNATKYGSSLSYSSNVLQLLDQDGNGLGSPVTIQSSPDIDGKSITTNSDDELQTVGVIDQNNTSNAIKTWTGTKAQYDTIVTKDATTLYNITDDSDVTLSLLELLYPVGSLYIATSNLSVCPLSVLGVGTWQLKSNSTLVTDINATAPVVGNGMTLGLTNGSLSGGFGQGYDAGQANFCGLNTSILLGDSVSTTKPNSGTYYNGVIGITSDSTKSGIEANITSTTLSVTIWERIS